MQTFKQLSCRADCSGPALFIHFISPSVVTSHMGVTLTNLILHSRKLKTRGSSGQTHTAGKLQSTDSSLHPSKAFGVLLCCIRGFFFPRVALLYIPHIQCICQIVKSQGQRKGWGGSSRSGLSFRLCEAVRTSSLPVTTLVSLTASGYLGLHGKASGGGRCAAAEGGC